MKRLLAIAALAASTHATAAHKVEEQSVAVLQARLSHGETTSQALVSAYLARIAAMDRAGPALHSVIALNPHALADARKLDAERRAGHVRGPLHGVPVLIKDNIESADDTATTAGSLALAGNVTGRDAPVVKRLTDAGAIILGKTNLSEWANIRSNHSISGWSAVGGLARNPYALDRNTCGSSAGTGAAIASSLAAVGIGTETNGSVTCPASVNGLVGLKPTVGLVSRTHIVPISHTQDTAGPMGRSVADVAALLTAMAGSDPADPATASADGHKADYAAALAGTSLKGRRLGVLRYAARLEGEQAVLFEASLAALRGAGAEIVEIADFRPPASLGSQESVILHTELKADLNAYLATTSPARVKTRTLADLIAFDKATPRELAIFGQEFFEEAQETRGLADPAYLAALAAAQKACGVDGIDKLLAEHKLDALIAPTTGPAWRTDIVGGDHPGGGAGGLAAIAGYPHLTVPMGLVKGLPVGLSFIAGAWSEARLLQIGVAFEAATQARRPPRYLPSVETADPYAAALEPAR